MRLTESTSGTGRRCRGDVNGSNKAFGAQSVVEPGTLSVFLNGQKLTEGEDYEVKWEIIGNVELETAPAALANDIVSLEYDVFGTRS